MFTKLIIILSFCSILFICRLEADTNIYNIDIDFNGADQSYINLDEERAIQAGKNNYVFKKNSTVLYYYKNGPVKKGILAKTADITIKNNRIQLYPDTVLYFYPNGQIEGINLKNSIQLSLHDQKTAFTNSEQAELPLRDISFYSNGDIKYGFLKKTTPFMINQKKIVFQKNTLTGFYPDGSIHDGTIQGEYPFQIRDKRISLKGLISFYEDGRVKNGILAKESKFKTGNYVITARKNSSIVFYQSGNIQYADLLNDIVIKTGVTKIYFEKKSVTRFNPAKDDNFNFISSEWELHAGQNKIRIAAGPCEFYENGQLKTGYLKKNSLLKVGFQEIPFLEGTIHFHDNGNIQSGLIYWHFFQQLDKKGQKLQNNQEIIFDRNGRMVIASYSTNQ